MFSTGQLIFAILFALGFTIIIILSYRQDKNLHKRNYQGVKWVGIAFITFVIILFLIKFFLKK